MSTARKRNPGCFPLPNWYLETKNISGIVYATGAWAVDEERGWVGRVHRQTDIALGYGLRPQEGAVVRGMVLGDASRIPEELEEAFRRSGITYVLAIQRPACGGVGGHDLLRPAPLRCACLIP
jgi:hypothetical protein